MAARKRPLSWQGAPRQLAHLPEGVATSQTPLILPTPRLIPFTYVGTS